MGLPFSGQYPVNESIFIDALNEYPEKPKTAK
jgi:hypothetical protein